MRVGKMRPVRLRVVQWPHHTGKGAFTQRATRTRRLPRVQQYNCIQGFQSTAG